MEGTRTAPLRHRWYWLAIVAVGCAVAGSALTYFAFDQLNQSEGEANFVLAHRYHEMGKDEDALAALNQALGIGIRGYGPLLLLAQMYEARNQPELALRFYRQALQEMNAGALVAIDRHAIEDGIARLTQRADGDESTRELSP